MVPATLVVIVLGCLALAAALLGGTSTGRTLLDRIRDGVSGGGAGAAGEVIVVDAVSLRAAAFDPFGGDGEHDELAPFAVDGDPATAWTTERYRSPIALLKPGVGIHVELDGPERFDHLVVETDATGWAAEIYVADAPGASLEAWGAPVAGRAGLDGASRFELDGREGAAVLVWFTDLGTAGPPYQLAVAELAVAVRR